MRILGLTFLLLGLLAVPASARTIDASSWSGKLIVVTDWKHHDESQQPGNLNRMIANADHVMSGRIHHMLLPRKAGTRHAFLGGAGSLTQLKGSVKSSYTDADPRRTVQIDCNGLMRNNGGDTMQFRTLMGYSPGVLRLEVDGLSIMPKETCSREDGQSPTFLDGWPQDYVFPLPAAAHAQRKLALQGDWWHFHSRCGLGEEREGSGAPPGPVHTNDGYETCTSGSVVRVQALLELKRKCRHVRMKATASSASEKCLRR